MVLPLQGGKEVLAVSWWQHTDMQIFEDFYITLFALEFYDNDQTWVPGCIFVYLLMGH